LVDASNCPNVNALQRHWHAALEQQTPFAELHSHHKEILMNNAECGPVSDGTSRAKVLCHYKQLLCKQIPVIDE
jgi:hypothetical protein